MARRRPMRAMPSSGRRGGSARLLMAAAIAIIALISFFSSREQNEITGETQYISLTPEQEIQMGLQAAPEMIKQHGGPHPDQAAQELLDQVCLRLIEDSVVHNTAWAFECTLLADDQTINAFALPGGQTFITAALYSKLESVGQLAGVMGHEIAHVVARHGAQRMAKQNLTQGLIQAVVVGAGDQGSAQMAAMIGQMVNMKYGRDDELESDRLGVQFMASAGYDPRAMEGVMEILAESRGGSGGQPEFFSTHPDPENRIERIREAIQMVFPDGVPEGLEK